MDFTFDHTHNISDTIFDIDLNNLSDTILDSDSGLEKFLDFSWDVGAGICAAAIFAGIGCVWKCRLVMTCDWWYYF